MDPSTWDGAAYTMGNSTKTWRSSYAPTLKNRSIQGAVNGYTNFTSQVSGAGQHGPPYIKPRLASATNASLALPASQAPSQKMPCVCLPQPQIGVVNAILVDCPRLSQSQSLEQTWGPEWGSW